MVVKFFNGLGRHAGVGEVHYNFVPGEFRGHAAADDMEGFDVGGRNDASHMDPGRLLNFVNPDEHPDARVPV